MAAPSIFTFTILICVRPGRENVFEKIHGKVLTNYTGLSELRILPPRTQHALCGSLMAPGIEPGFSGLKQDIITTRILTALKQLVYPIAVFKSKQHWKAKIWQFNQECNKILKVNLPCLAK